MSARGLHAHVRLAGFRQCRDLPTYYGLASALVHPSTREPWEFAVNEAMAAGLPVIVSERCGCAEDLVKAGATGIAAIRSTPDVSNGFFSGSHPPAAIAKAWGERVRR